MVGAAANAMCSLRIKDNRSPQFEIVTAMAANCPTSEIGTREQGVRKQYCRAKDAIRRYRPSVLNYRGKVSEQDDLDDD